MRKTLGLAILLSIGISLKAQQDIQGIWMTHEENSKIEIYEQGNQCFGKVVWLKEPYDRKGNPKTDRNNPDKSLRNREIVGTDMLTGLSFIDGAWRGKIYAARQGKTMDVVVKPIGDNELEIHVSFLGMSRVKKWTRDSI